MGMGKVKKGSGARGEVVVSGGSGSGSGSMIED